MTKFAHPSRLTGRVADNEGVIRDMFGHDGPRPNKSKTTNIMPADDGGVGTNAGTATNPGLGVLASPIAVGMGAALLEKHFTLDKTKPGFDNSMALNVDDLATFVSQCKLAGQMLGSPDRHVSDAEMKSRGNMRRSIYAEGPIRAGESIRREHLQLKRPAAGLGPDQLDRVVGRVAKVDMDEGDIVTEDLLG